MNGKEIKLKKEATEPETQELNLAVPVYQSCEEDEDDDDEMSDSTI